MARVVLAERLGLLLGELAQLLHELPILLRQLVVLVEIFAEHEQRALRVALRMWVERCLVGNTVLLHVQVELDLSNEALLVPQPNYQPVVRFTSL